MVVLKSVFPFLVEPETLFTKEILLLKSVFCFVFKRFVLRGKENLLSQKAIALRERIFSSSRGYFPMQEGFLLFERVFSSARGYFPLQGGISRRQDGELTPFLMLVRPLGNR